jgi:hypothetical protein
VRGIIGILAIGLRIVAVQATSLGTAIPLQG